MDDVRLDTNFVDHLVVGPLFLLRRFTRPLGQELRESEEASAGVGNHGEGIRRPGDSAG